MTARTRGRRSLRTDLKVGDYGGKPKNRPEGRPLQRHGGWGKRICSGQPLGWFRVFPGGGPCWHAGGTLHPLNGLGTAEGKILGTRAEMFADGIPPDVSCDSFDGIAWAKNVVVVALLPESAGERFPELEGSVLFEKADKFAQVRLRVSAFCQDVQVVWHDAECVEDERIVRGAFVEEFQNELGKCGRAKMR